MFYYIYTLNTFITSNSVSLCHFRGLHFAPTLAMWSVFFRSWIFSPPCSRLSDGADGPQIVCDSVDVDVELGQRNVCIRCHVTARPPPTSVFWQVGGDNNSDVIADDAHWAVVQVWLCCASCAVWIKNRSYQVTNSCRFQTSYGFSPVGNRNVYGERTTMSIFIVTTSNYRKRHTSQFTRFFDRCA